VGEVIPRPLGDGARFQGRYRVVRCLRAGGMGAVYEVVHVETKRRRALKVMLPGLLADPDLRARFRQEATVTAEVESEHIVETFDAGVDEETGAPFLVMELLRGADLGGVLTKRGALPADEVVTLLRQLAAALDKTHAAGIVHRDLKPENLFLTQRDDGSPRLKVLDFGIAKIVDQGANGQATRSMGSPVYMAPEQLKGDGAIGPRADLYSVAHIAYTLLVGTEYWADDLQPDYGVWQIITTVMAGMREPPCARAARRGVRLPPGFDGWFLKATAASPEERFELATPMIAALAEVLDSGAASRLSARTLASAVSAEAAPSQGLSLPPSASAEPGTTPTLEPAGVRRSPLPIIAGALLAVLFAGIMWTLGSKASRRSQGAAAAPSAAIPTATAEPAASSAAPLVAPSGAAPAVSATPAPTPAPTPPPRPPKTAAPAPPKTTTPAPPPPPLDPTKLR
jgi:serine/threonine-protein kinase